MVARERAPQRPSRRLFVGTIVGVALVMVLLASCGYGSVSGTVRDETGAPVRGANIHIAFTTSTSLPAIAIQTGSDGRYDAASLRAGPALLVA